MTHANRPAPQIAKHKSKRVTGITAQLVHSKLRTCKIAPPAALLFLKRRGDIEFSSRRFGARRSRTDTEEYIRVPCNKFHRAAKMICLIVLQLSFTVDLGTEFGAWAFRENVEARYMRIAQVAR